MPEWAAGSGRRGLLSTVWWGDTGCAGVAIFLGSEHQVGEHCDGSAWSDAGPHRAVRAADRSVRGHSRHWIENGRMVRCQREDMMPGSRGVAFSDQRCYTGVSLPVGLGTVCWGVIVYS